MIPPAPRLVTAVDIASARVRAMPAGTLERNIARMAAYYDEVRKAREELERGEWVLEEPAVDALR